MDAYKDKNNKIIVEKRKVLDRWAEFFEALLYAGEGEIDEDENPIL